MKKIQTLATASLMTAAFAVSPAAAGGSIGGDCCADLEERVAELEATTVRKGNRKVSLKLSGHVNKAIVFGGGDYDPEIIDNGISQSRFRLTGKAKITSDLYAGYAIEFGLGSGTDKDISGEGIFTELRKNELYIGSKTLGKLSIGKGSTASDGVSEVDLSGTGVAGGTLNISKQVGTGDFFNLDGFSRKERVRYDSPSLAGFKVSASWVGENSSKYDDVDVAVRFAQALGDFKVAAAVGFYHDDSADETGVSGSASALHVPTGLNVTFAAGDDNISKEFWYVKAGIKQKIFAAGATAFSVDYHDINDGADEKFGVQLVQKVDAAAMELYAGYYTIDSNDEDRFYLGSRIKF